MEGALYILMLQKSTDTLKPQPKSQDCRIQHSQRGTGRCSNATSAATAGDGGAHFETRKVLIMFLRFCEFCITGFDRVLGHVVLE